LDTPDGSAKPFEKKSWFLCGVTATEGSPLRRIKNRIF
jgi:hypothetical protein